MLSTEDRVEISETLAQHAFIFDENQLARLEELFTPEAVYDMALTGLGTFEGIDAIRAAAGQMFASGHAPLAHFVTNIVVTSGDEDGVAVALSKGLMLMADGSVHGVTHDDTLRRHNGYWRISRRHISPVRAPSAAAATDR